MPGRQQKFSAMLAEEYILIVPLAYELLPGRTNNSENMDAEFYITKFAFYVKQ